MAEKRTIHCEDCKHEYETVRANTKFCQVCRTFKDLVYVGTDTRKCWLCDSTFAPLHRKDEACADCSPRTGKMLDGECVLCQGHRHPLLSGDILVCLGCAKDPERRRTFGKAIRAKVVRRREEVAA